MGGVGGRGWVRRRVRDAREPVGEEGVGVHGGPPEVRIDVLARAFARAVVQPAPVCKHMCTSVFISIDVKEEYDRPPALNPNHPLHRVRIVVL
jgi:hypothetical protein